MSQREKSSLGSVPPSLAGKKSSLPSCPRIGRKVEDAIRQQLDAGHGIPKVARMVGCASGAVQRVKREMAVIGANA
jgi:hypothetical protein